MDMIFKLGLRSTGDDDIELITIPRRRDFIGSSERGGKLGIVLSDEDDDDLVSDSAMADESAE
jgi:hypothetical protein